MVQEKYIYDNYKLFFVMMSYQIITLNHDQSYLRLLMLNTGTKQMIYYY